MKPFICLHCGFEIGFTDGARLVFDGIWAVCSKVRVECPNCHHHRVWYPCTTVTGTNYRNKLVLGSQISAE